MRGADSARNYYQLKDAAQRALLSVRRPLETDSRADHGAGGGTEGPVDAGGSHGERGGRRIAEASYTQRIEFFPELQLPVLFSFNVDTVSAGYSAPTLSRIRRIESKSRPAQPDFPDNNDKAVLGVRGAFCVQALTFFLHDAGVGRILERCKVCVDEARTADCRAQQLDGNAHVASVLDRCGS